MAHPIPGIPIVVPGTTTSTGHAQSGVVWAGKTPADDRDSNHEDREELSTPPAKKMAMDMGSGVVTLGNRLPPGIGNFIVTPGGSVVPHPSSPQLIQMATPGQPQIPIVIPAPLPARANGQEGAGQRHTSPKRVEAHNDTPETSTHYPTPLTVRAPHSAPQQFMTPLSESETGQRSVETAEERSPGRPKMSFANISIKSGEQSDLTLVSACDM